MHIIIIMNRYYSFEWNLLYPSLLQILLQKVLLFFIPFSGYVRCMEFSVIFSYCVPDFPFLFFIIFSDSLNSIREIYKSYICRNIVYVIDVYKYATWWLLCTLCIFVWVNITVINISRFQFSVFFFNFIYPYCEVHKTTMESLQIVQYRELYSSCSEIPVVVVFFKSNCLRLQYMQLYVYCHIF